MKKQVAQVILIIALCSIPLIILCSCGGSDNFKCTWCGDSENRILGYASGSNSEGIKYKSCIGVSGYLGVGCDTPLLPVECMQIEISSTALESQTGCIVFYEDGCIDGQNVKYQATLKESGCLGNQEITKINDYGDSVKISIQNSCLGCVTSNDEITLSEDEMKEILENADVNYDNYDEYMAYYYAYLSYQDFSDYFISERQFPTGCWSCSGCN